VAWAAHALRLDRAMVFDRRLSSQPLRLVTTDGEAASPPVAAATTVLHAIGGAADQRAAEAVASALVRGQVEQVLVHAGQPPVPGIATTLPQDAAIATRWLRLPPAAAHGERTASLLRAFEAVLVEDRPDVVVTYGASDAALACALAAAKQNIAIAHLGSGARHEAPEAQINRAICERLADTLLTPTAEAAAQLTSEGIPDTRVHVIGDLTHPEDALGAADVIVAHYVLQGTGATAWGRRFPRNSLHA
jgi:UDP-N-acetylglucosamine 2-epimerase